MYKTFVLFAVLVAFPISLVLSGCGPKAAKPETVTEMEAAKNAAEAAETELQQLEAELNKCGMETVEKENKIKKLERQRDGLKSGH